MVEISKTAGELVDLCAYADQAYILDLGAIDPGSENDST